MSGAGRSRVARALEDLGWFVVDNLPPQLLDDLVASVAAREEASRLAVVVDVRVAVDILELRSPTCGMAAATFECSFSKPPTKRSFDDSESNRRPHLLQAVAASWMA